MPFLPQPSQFVLAWDRHQTCWLAYPVAWFAVKIMFQNCSTRFWLKKIITQRIIVCFRLNTDSQQQINFLLQYSQISLSYFINQHTPHNNGKQVKKTQIVLTCWHSSDTVSPSYNNQLHVEFPITNSLDKTLDYINWWRWLSPWDKDLGRNHEASGVSK